MLTRTCLFLLTVASLTLAGARAADEPRNLGPHKKEVRAYVESGDYDRDIATVAARAKAWIEQRASKRISSSNEAQRGEERLAVVFDLDETLLKNWPEIGANDFGYIPAAWEAWVRDAKAPAIEPVREVYRTARRLGMNVIVLTGRRERERADTEKNLRAIECADHTELIFMPDAFKGTTEAFKTAERKRLAGAGLVIVANIGDQESDLAGGYSERTFKLPNPFYVTP